MDTAKLGWLNEFVSTQRQDIQLFFTAYSNSLAMLEHNFASFKKKLKTEIEEENAQTQNLTNIMDSLKSINLQELSRDLDNIKGEMNGLVTDYKSSIMSNNDLAAKVYDTYSSTSNQLDAIQSIVTSLNGEVGSVMSYVDEYKHVMSTKK